MLAKRAWVVLLVVVCAVYFYGLGSVPLLGPDEPRYAEVAREMYARGDYVTPRLGGHTWFEKPALAYWLMAASYRLFGVNEFGARFPAILLALLSVLTVFYTGCRIVSVRAGLMAALALECSAAFIAFSRAASTD